MKTLEEFKLYYSTKLLSDVQKLERERVEVSRRVLMTVSPVIVLSAILSFATIQYENAPFFILFAGGAIAFVIYQFLTKGYVSSFKEVVIRKIINFIDEKLKYDKSGYISQAEYLRSKLFLSHPDRYHGDDRVSGMLGKTQVDFSELHSQYVTRDSKGRTQTHTIFKGLFFKADFNKNFIGETFVLPDNAEKLLGSFGQIFQKMTISRPQIVRLEDPDFEKEFVVYGSDQTEARYILSPSLMKRILDFRRKSNKRISLSFIDSSVYIAIPYVKNLFEPKIFSTLLDFTPIQEYFQDLQLALGIVEDLNLNTRIWTKE